MTYRWTPRRDRELGELRADGFKYAEIDRMLGCERGGAAMRAAELRRVVAAPALDFKAVPRPVEIRKPGLIDLRHAPSSMEQLADRWAGR